MLDFSGELLLTIATKNEHSEITNVKLCKLIHIIIEGKI